MEVGAEKWVAHNYSTEYILQKLLLCSTSTKAFRYLRELINLAVKRPADSYTDVLRRAAKKFNVSVTELKRSVKLSLWISLLFRSIDIEFWSVIEGRNVPDMPLWRRRIDMRYIVDTVATYRSDRERSVRRYTWNKY